MDRRDLLAAAGVLLAAPLARAQPATKVYRVALVFLSAPVSDMAGAEPVHPLARAFVHALRGLGYVEGRNLLLERRSLEGKRERAAEVLAEVLRLKPDVIVSASNAITLAAKDATATVPIVMAGNATPVEAGLVASLGRPGGNVTGLTFDVGPEIESKRLELLKEAIPGISRVAFVGSDSLWEVAGARHVRKTAQALGLQIVLAASKGNDFAPAFAAVTRERADALFVATETITYQNRVRIIAFAAETRRPASYGHPESVLDGGLMSYGMRPTEVYRRAAAYVDKILKGATPADLPVEQGTQIELLVNLKTAKALRLAIPQSILLRAHEVIQ